MIDLEKMAKEHERLFPKASLESQIWKLEEETKEFQLAETEQDKMKELADVLIVCAGIYRFDKRKAIDESNNVYNVCVWMDIDQEDLAKEVNRKWQVNLKRKWVWNGKTYKHVKGTGE